MQLPATLKIARIVLYAARVPQKLPAQVAIDPLRIRLNRFLFSRGESCSFTVLIVLLGLMLLRLLGFILLGAD